MVAPEPNAGAGCTYLSWSPDGSRVSVHSSGCVCQVPSDRTRLLGSLFAGAGGTTTLANGTLAIMPKDQLCAGCGKCKLSYASSSEYQCVVRENVPSTRLSRWNARAACRRSRSWNADWPHCVGAHELFVGLSIRERNVSKLGPVQRAVDLLNERGIAIAITGPTGSGKTTLQGLAVHCARCGPNCDQPQSRTPLAAPCVRSVCGRRSAHDGARRHR